MLTFSEPCSSSEISKGNMHTLWIPLDQESQEEESYPRPFVPARGGTGTIANKQLRGYDCEAFVLFRGWPAAIFWDDLVVAKIVTVTAQ